MNGGAGGGGRGGPRRRRVPLALDDCLVGAKPPPPGRIRPEEILEACKSVDTRYAVVVRERTPVDPTKLEKSGSVSLELPLRLVRLVRDRQAGSRTFPVQEMRR